MFSLQRLLGKEDKFFNLLEAGAEEARTSVQALVKLTRSQDQTALLYEFTQPRKKEKQIRAEFNEAVYTTFVTALEREDIENLSYAIYRIPKAVEKFAQRLALTPEHGEGRGFFPSDQPAGAGDGHDLRDGQQPSRRCRTSRS